MRWFSNFTGIYSATGFSEKQIQAFMNVCKEKNLEPTYQDCEHFLKYYQSEEKMSFKKLIEYIVEHDDLDRVEGCFSRYQGRHFDGDLIKA